MSTESANAFRSPGLKLFAIAALTVALAIPLLLIQSIVDERRSYADQAVTEIAQGWGGVQQIMGPFLVVPYFTPEVRNDKGGIVTFPQRRTVILAPRTLEIGAVTTTDTRHRGMFEAIVYATPVDVWGTFDLGDAAKIVGEGGRIDSTNVQVALGLSDLQGVTGDITLAWNGQTIQFEGGPRVAGLTSGVHADAPLPEGSGEVAFRIALPIRGTRTLSFVPVGESTTVTVWSNWPHPSFFGAPLPVDRNVVDSGFDAKWRVPALARNLPRAWADGAPDVLSGLATFGVSFYQPVDFYQLVERSLKYAILFIGLAFLLFFLAETLTGARIHLVQYLLVGSAQVIFYLLLLALAEQTGFTVAYAAASLGSVLLTALYALSVLGTRMRAAAVFGGLASLYGLLFVLLNEEDYALLTGAVALFAALALTMFATRRIDWYGLAGGDARPPVDTAATPGGLT